MDFYGPDAGNPANAPTLQVVYEPQTGERGFYPMSLGLTPSYIAGHWAAVEEGAQRTGRTPSRADWRVEREVFVADTDAEAERWCLHGNMGRMFGEYFIPLFDAMSARPEPLEARGGRRSGWCGVFSASGRSPRATYPS